MIVGHERQRDYLKKVHERGTDAHAYLFFGPEHVGKRAVALDWIKLFFPKEDAAAIGENRHPSVTHLSKAKLLASDNEKEIGIDDILELRHQNALRPFSGTRSFVIIDGADDLSEEAQNSFLKTLEEPSRANHFILITDSPDGVLPTVRSRSVPLEFSFVPDSAIEKFLNEENTAMAMTEKIAAMALGRPGIAVSALRNAQFFEEEWARLEFFRNIRDLPLVSQFVWSKKNANDAELVEKFIFFLFSDLHKRLASDNVERGAARAAKALLSSLELLKHTNVNRWLLLDTIFLNCVVRSAV